MIEIINPFKTSLTEDEVISTRIFIYNLLHDPESNMEITFTKLDGSERVMNCTMVMDLIPEDMRPKTLNESSDPQDSKHNSPHNSACRVFDVDKQAWRSFRWDSITKFKFNNNIDSIDSLKNPSYPYMG
jgi:hypothetical protein